VPTMFTAYVAGVDDGDCLVAGVAERDDGTGRALIFQASLEEPDEQDVDLGMDTYCLVTEQQGTAYGCVQELTIDGDRLRMLLREDALADLGLPDSAVEVRLAVDTAAIDQLGEALRQILSYGRESARPSVLRL
jgi:immunity protein 10 of polymorphic toxin system